MKNLTPEERLKIYQAINDKDGIKAMLEIIARYIDFKGKREHQKTMKEFVK